MASVELVGGGGQLSMNGNLPKLPEPPKAKREYRVGKKHAKYSLADKVKIVKYIEKGMKTSEIWRLTGAPESTVRTLKQKKGTIKQQTDIGKKYFGTHERMSADTSEYRKIIAITEAYLSKWLSRREQEDSSVSGPELREQARVIYSAVCKKKNISSPPSFKASVGWLANFKKRCQVKLAKYHRENASADISGADSFPAIAKQIVEDGGYSYEQIYNYDEIGFYWKKSHTITYMHKTEKQAKGTKLARPSSTPAHILTVKEFWKKFNIRNAVDTMVDSWNEINVSTITHPWTPLFPHLKVECGSASAQATAKLAKILAECSDTKESLQEFTQDAPELQNALPHLDSLNDILMAIYNCKIREKQQSVITRLFRRRQDVADAIQNICEADGAENAATADVEPLKNDLDFEGFLDVAQDGPTSN
ncbi:Tigger transposable element-derived protein 1-like 107 [Homarus americanus]|uniref:Tigger transposable element-derived protein 1-like 107 n=1 Tax=Homarus americanus TaxID=6706 RepID=A0A8J5JWR4_HOMAM|nr:Tigger transposable element-derived protein 1-like 107 [Homarus americanus]